VVTENVADILYATRLDPSMTILKSASAEAAAGEMVCAAISDVLKQAGVGGEDATKLAGQMNNSYAGDSAACAGLTAETQAVFKFQSNHGNEVMQGVSLMSKVNAQTEWLAQSRAELSIEAGTIASAANYAGMGGLVSDVFSLEIMDKNRKQISSFTNPIWVKLPYKGGNANIEQVSLITSADGTNWTRVSAENIIALQAQSEDTMGYVAFSTTHFSYYALVDSTVSVDGETEQAPAAGGGGGGGCTVRPAAPFDPLLPLMLVLGAGYIWQRRVTQRV
ncbi:MAG: JDVT-CTERM domain-containing protein, partial [Gammaproteobacteria bacterium]|nr:JDVT-CTERM domain-containing protein [Gammaproteobacteria bacterium]